jgi:hypothetical protein
MAPRFITNVPSVESLAAEEAYQNCLQKGVVMPDDSYRAAPKYEEQGAERRHRILVRQELIAADQILAKYIGPTHVIRAELEKIINAHN